MSYKMLKGFAFDSGIEDEFHLNFDDLSTCFHAVKVILLEVRYYLNNLIPDKAVSFVVL